MSDDIEFKVNPPDICPKCGERGFHDFGGFFNYPKLVMCRLQICSSRALNTVCYGNIQHELITGDVIERIERLEEQVIELLRIVDKFATGIDTKALSSLAAPQSGAACGQSSVVERESS